ncbi:MAG: hypothetical protein K9K67_09410, partial [Bacteriovoracaceae bacterium]|nr:hypothetical protein [Bacteriovoracaceae bacterium]
MFDFQTTNRDRRKRETSHSLGEASSPLSHLKSSRIGGRLFSTEGVFVKYGNASALAGVDFKVHQGEIV